MRHCGPRWNLAANVKAQVRVRATDFHRPSADCDGKKRAPDGAPFRQLALGELEAATRAGAAVLLALDDAAVAGQEAVHLHGATQSRLELGEGLGDAVAHRPRLARQT